MNTLAPLVLLAVGAATGAPAQAPPSLERRRVVLELVLLGDAQTTPLLVGLQAPGAEGLAREVTRVRPDAALELVSLDPAAPLAEQVALAMGQAGAHCAVTITAASHDRYHLRRWGDCAVDPGVVPGPEPRTGLRVAQAFDDDPRDPSALAEQLSLSLVDSDGAWVVREGSGYELSTLRFALQVGDGAAVDQLVTEHRNGSAAALGLGLGGGLTILTGLGLVAAGFGEASTALRYEDQIHDEQLGWTGVVLCAAGSLLVGSVLPQRRSVGQRREHPDRFYDRQQAEALIRDYNADLVSGLGVAEVPQAVEPRGDPLDEPADEPDDLAAPLDEPADQPADEPDDLAAPLDEASP